MRPVLTVIPAYGFVTLTETVVRHLLREPDVTDVLVVDNGGDYAAVGAETVHRPGSNLGWLGGCNAGLERGWSAGYEHVLLLNNDVRLSAGFVRGLLDAAAETGGVVAPVYDDDAAPQQQLLAPVADVDAFCPRPVERAVSVIDGTAMLVPRRAGAALGPLDRRFRRHGWGATEDWWLTASEMGVPVHVTERAYLTHQRRSTAGAINERYTTFASAEMHYGLIRKWGRDWSARLPGSGQTRMTTGQFLGVAFWHWLEVVGVGRLLQRPPSAP